MKKNLFIVVALAIAIAGALTLLSMHQRAPESSTPIPAPRAAQPAPPAPIPQAAVVLPKPEPVAEPVQPSMATPAPTKLEAPAAAPKAASAKPAPKDKLQDPMARVALGMVGADSEAEGYWADAIFDTSLPDQEREDLMEDLNEVGLSDPKHPTPEDMQLIAARIPIIEEVAQEAARQGDMFMLEHLGEAYKDLIGLLNGQPPP